MRRFAALAMAFSLLTACSTPDVQTTASAASTATPVSAPRAGSRLTGEQTATLGSLELVDDHPLYTMRYTGPYSDPVSEVGSSLPLAAMGARADESCSEIWGCSLFAALGDQNDRLLGRNFDWRFSPALLLFTEPADGYASVSMVDMEYLDFTGERSKMLTDLPLEARRSLLDAPLLPFDGMNERGIAVGMAAVPPGNMRRDPQKQTIDELQAIREILDHAATVDEAIDLLGRYNIDMGSVPIHYLIASASGESALVEFYEGKMEAFRNASSWQTATNFLVASTNGHPQGQCPRYDRMSRRLEELQGRISRADAAQLLEEVSQDTTQWSIVYHVTSGDIEVVMGGGYSQPAHTFRLKRSGR